MTITAEQFVRWRYEMGINEKMLSRSFSLPASEVLEYVNAILSLDVQSLVDFIRNDDDLPIVTEDIFQFSSLSDATDRLCTLMTEVGDPVVDAPELGRLLLGDGVPRNVVAYRKYGENHGKMAARLGLVQLIEKHYLLSCLGAVFPRLIETDRRKLLARLLLRTPFVSHLLRINAECIDMRKVMSELSDTTYLRRRSSTRCMLRLLADFKEFDFSKFLNRIRFV